MLVIIVSNKSLGNLSASVASAKRPAELIQNASQLESILPHYSRVWVLQQSAPLKNVTFLVQKLLFNGNITLLTSTVSHVKCSSKYRTSPWMKYCDATFQKKNIEICSEALLCFWLLTLFTSICLAEAGRQRQKWGTTDIFVCSPSFFCLPAAASRLSCVVWFSRALSLRSLYYPWGKMETTRSLDPGCSK